MTEKDNKMLILFLETFKQQLLDMAETMKTRTFRRSELDNVFAFKIAGNQEKQVIHEMVSEVTLNKGTELQTGQESLMPVTDADQVSSETNGNDMGKAKTYASSHFRSDKEAA
jgi:hypothetical protein